MVSPLLNLSHSRMPGTAALDELAVADLADPYLTSVAGHDGPIGRSMASTTLFVSDPRPPRLEIILKLCHQMADEPGITARC
jgi:hypothetical protein